MALVSSALTGLLASQFTSNQIVGERMTSLANAIGTGVGTFMFTGKVSATIVGFLGAGTATGTGIPALQGSLIESSILSNFASQGITGQYMPSFAKAIGQSIGSWLSSAQAVVPIAGAGSGSGTGTLIGFIPTTCSSLILSQLTSQQFLGQYANAFAQAVGTGFGSLVNGQTMVLTCAGNVSPSAGSGSGVGNLL